MFGYRVEKTTVQGILTTVFVITVLEQGDLTFPRVPAVGRVIQLYHLSQITIQEEIWKKWEEEMETVEMEQRDREKFK